MERLFLRILQMSLAGGIVILAVLLFRLLLRRAPGKYRYLLWIAAAFRLCVPVSLPSPISLFRLFRGQSPGSADYSPAALTRPLETVMLVSGSGAAAGSGAAVTPAEAAVPAFFRLSLPVWIWITLAAALLICGMVSSLRLRRRLSTAVRLEGRVYQASGIDTPFLMRLFRPRIYIPWGLEGRDLAYALAHEECHLRRGDQWWRFLAWLILCVHWYNPLCWLSYFLMERDMEASCDEAVLARMGDVRREYSESLLHIAGKKPLTAPAPPAFGESDVKTRVRNVLRWKKTKGRVSIAAALLCILFTAAWITDPASLSPSALALNPDGTVGRLTWGMSPEEAMAADSRLTPSVPYNNDFHAENYVFLMMDHVQVLGHTAEVTLSFPRRTLSVGLRRDKTGSPILEEISILIPGDVDVREALTRIFGEQEHYMVGESWEFVDGRAVIQYRPNELSEDKWYWHSAEMATDLIPIEQLRLTLPADWPDEQVLGVWCSTFAFKVSVEKKYMNDDGSYLYEEYYAKGGNGEAPEDRLYTEIWVYGMGAAAQRFLQDREQPGNEGG